MPILKHTTIGIFLSLSIIAGCNSSNDSNSTSAVDTDTPVQGENHLIAPGEVDAYIAAFEEQRSRVAFTLDGTPNELFFEGEDREDNLLVTSYGDNLVFIGFNLETEEPIPRITIMMIENDSVTKTFVGNNLDIQSTAEEDIVYTGRVKDTSNDNELDINLVFNESLVTAGTSTITVTGTDAFLNGDMGTGTYAQMRDMIAANPSVDRLIIQQSTGSVNDAINVHTGRLIRSANLATHVPADGDINSGAVDLFTAGVKRTVEEGGILGVHSWCCEDGVTADKLPRSHPGHGTQLTYFREMLDMNGEDFYFFTLQAAPFTTVHPMTRAEMTQFGVVTE